MAPDIRLARAVEEGTQQLSQPWHEPLVGVAEPVGQLHDIAAITSSARWRSGA